MKVNYINFVKLFRHAFISSNCLIKLKVITIFEVILIFEVTHILTGFILTGVDISFAKRAILKPALKWAYTIPFL